MKDINDIIFIHGLVKYVGKNYYKINIIKIGIISAYIIKTILF